MGDQFSSQCKEQPQSFLASVPANSFLADSKPADAPKLLAHHQVLLQQIEDLKASKNAKGSKVRSAAPPTAPKAKKESKWDEAKHMVEKMSKNEEFQLAVVLSLGVLLCLCQCCGGCSKS